MNRSIQFAALAVLLGMAVLPLAAPTSSTAASAAPALTAAQKARMLALVSQAKARQDAIRDNKSLTDDQKLAQVAQVQQWLQAQKLAVMTPGQRSITMAGQDSKQAALQQLDSLSSRLKTSLSADQHRQVTDILQNLSAQSSTILANKALSRGQKDQQIEALSIAANARVLSVLTPEQRHMAKDLDQAADRFNGAPSGPCRGLEASVSCL